jgi:hypothetical protein
MAENKVHDSAQKLWTPLTVSVLALVVSSAVLVVSAAAFYYSSLRVKDSLLVSISSYTTTSIPGQDICFTLTIANNGTRAAVFSDVGTARSRATMLDTPEAVSLSERLPIIVPPREMRLLTIGVSGEQIRQELSQRKAADFYLAYEGSGPSGKRYYGLSAQIIEIREHKPVARWLTGAKEPLKGLFQPTDLFQGETHDLFKLHMWSTRQATCTPSAA